MEKRYFAWKDGKQSLDKNQQWVELSAKDFLEICKSNIYKSPDTRRYFARLSGVENSDIYYLFECDYVNYLKSVNESMHRMRKRIEIRKNENKGLNIRMISLDFSMTDENGDEYNLHDLIGDPDSAFKDKILISMDLERAISMLSEEERQMVNALYLANKPISEKKLAEKENIPRTTLQSRKYKALKKIKKYFGSC